MLFAEVGERAVEIAKKAGIEQTEAYILNAKALSIEISKQQVEDLKFSNEKGMGIRVISQGKMGFAYTAEFSIQAIKNTVQESINNLKYSAIDTDNVLPNPDLNYPSLDLFDPSIELVSLEDKINLAKRIELAACSYDPRIKKTEKSIYQDVDVETVLVNSQGIAVNYKSNHCGAYAWLVAEEDGDVQTGSGMDFTKRLNLLNPEAAGKEAARKAVQMLKARSVRTKRVPLIFDPYVLTNFLGLFSSAVTAEAVQKGKSVLAGRLGQKIVSELVTIIDDGSMPKGLASAIADGEGVPTSKTTVIDGGKLESFLYNTYTAQKEGRKSTGNAVRGGFSSTPEVGTTNFYLDKGDICPEELIRSVREGFYVTEVMGMHTANPISGDFSIGASGLWIENGELGYPVRGAAIAGNILELFNTVEAVGTNLRFFGSLGAPTVLFGKMMVSGK